MSTAVHDVIVLDEKIISVDGVRYIRSWKGTKPPKCKTKEEKTEYMQAYRLSKKHELLNLKKANLELEDQIRSLFKKNHNHHNCNRITVTFGII